MYIVQCVYPSVRTTSAYPSVRTINTYPNVRAINTYPSVRATSTYPSVRTINTYPNVRAINTYPSVRATSTYPSVRTINTYPNVRAINTYPSVRATSTYPSVRATSTYPNVRTINTYPNVRAINTYPNVSAINTYPSVRAIAHLWIRMEPRRPSIVWACVSTPTATPCLYTILTERYKMSVSERESVSEERESVSEREKRKRVRGRYILLTKTTAAQNGVALSYHKVRGLYFLAVVFVRSIVRESMIFYYLVKYKFVHIPNEGGLRCVLNERKLQTEKLTERRQNKRQMDIVTEKNGRKKDTVREIGRVREIE